MNEPSEWDPGEYTLGREEPGGLTRRQRELLDYVREGLTVAEMAERAGVTKQRISQGLGRLVALGELRRGEGKGVYVLDDDERTYASSGETAPLSNRQRDVLALVHQSMSVDTMQDRMGMSRREMNRILRTLLARGALAYVPTGKVYIEGGRLRYEQGIYYRADDKRRHPEKGSADDLPLTDWQHDVLLRAYRGMEWKDIAEDMGVNPSRVVRVLDNLRARGLLATQPPTD